MGTDGRCELLTEGGNYVNSFKDEEENENENENENESFK
jgi:hypothetical protein